jgi:hypothetical protein
MTHEIVTRLALKSLNRSLKSELTNIAAFAPCRVDNQFPGRVEARLSRLVLPKLQIKRPIKLAQFAMLFDKSGSHRLLASRF